MRICEEQVDKTHERVTHEILRRKGGKEEEMGLDKYV